MKKLSIMLVAAALLAVAAGVGYAAIPSSNGTISACKDGKGALKVIDAEAGATCNANQQLLTWNQQGPSGPPGVSGYEIVTVATPGPASASLKSATAPCPAGKVAVGGGAKAWGTISGELSHLAHGIALVHSGPSTGESSGWSAAARVVSATSEGNWQLEVHAICATAG